MKFHTNSTTGGPQTAARIEASASYARDVLFMIGAGLAQGKITAPDIEMMLSDGPKRVALLDLVVQALADLPAPATGPDAEQIPEPTRQPLTPPSAHPILELVDAYTQSLGEYERQQYGTRAYYSALIRCDMAWERIAHAVGVAL